MSPSSSLSSSVLSSPRVVVTVTPWAVACTLLGLLALAAGRKWEPSQAAVLLECMREWRADFFGWSYSSQCFQAELVTCDEDGMVTSMSLVGMGLNGSIPSSIGLLTRMTYLDLSDNHLGSTVPRSLQHLSYMDTLNLAKNELNGSIPEFIGTLTRTTFLNLAGNQFSESVPSSVGDLVSLHYLDISNNSLSGALPPSLGNLTDLRSLKFNSSMAAPVCPSSGECTVRQNMSSAFCSVCAVFCRTCGELLGTSAPESQPSSVPSPPSLPSIAPASASLPPPALASLPAPASLAPPSLSSIPPPPTSSPPIPAPVSNSGNATAAEGSTSGTRKEVPESAVALAVVAAALAAVAVACLLMGVRWAMDRRDRSGNKAAWEPPA
ncbi:hypothetical protein CLOM_g17136 [Closterium sp. NIES-68]|nr:hypothetical protein CLOM_g17136 [Closterium sp. NIES-68]